jgi:hypothetical protein
MYDSVEGGGWPIDHVRRRARCQADLRAWRKAGVQA